MLDDYSSYPKERVKLFLKYLGNAASRHNRRNSRPLRKPDNIYSEDEINDLTVKTNFLEKRLIEISDIRRDQLETKIKAHYTQNKYLPFEMRLKKLRQRITRMKKTKKHNSKKLDRIDNKIKRCQVLLKEIRKKDLL